MRARNRKAFIGFYAVGMLCAVFSSGVQAADLTFVIHPIIESERIPTYYKPLGDYIAKAVGGKVEIKASRNYQSHWHSLRKNIHADLILDGPHITDWLHKFKNYEPLVKVRDVISYTLVSKEDDLIFEPRELVGYRVATVIEPSLGALALDEMFPNPLRRPRIVSTDDSAAAVQMVLNGKARAAIIPSPMVGAYEGLNTVQVTEQFPHVAISCRKDMDPVIKNKIRKALIEASNNPQGQKMLQSIQVAGYEEAKPEMYDGISDDLMQGVFGK